MRKLFIAIPFVFASGAAFAAVKCDLEQVKGVQVKLNGDVLFTSSEGKRRKIGSAANQTASNYSLQVISLALEKRLYVQAAFPDGYDCSAPNSELLAEWIYVQNAQ